MASRVHTGADHRASLVRRRRGQALKCLGCASLASGASPYPKPTLPLGKPTRVLVLPSSDSGLAPDSTGGDVLACTGVGVLVGTGSRVHLDAGRFQGGDAQQGLGGLLSEHDGPPSGLSHEFYLPPVTSNVVSLPSGIPYRRWPLGVRPMDSRCCLGTRQPVAPVSTRKSPSQTRSGSAKIRMATVTCIAPVAHPLPAAPLNSDYSRAGLRVFGLPPHPRGVLIVCRPSYPPLTRLSREACPRPRSGSGNPDSITRHSRESGNPYVLDVGLPLDKPKVHGKIGVVPKTKRPPRPNPRHLALAPSYDHSLRC